jgi:DNA-binding transcriptional MerR regulator
MKIGDVAERLGTTTRTLRFYDEAGLINPCRTAKGTRLYSESDLERFRAILLLGQLGVPIQQMRRLATTRSQSATGNDSSRDVAEQLTALKSMAEERMVQYRKLLNDVELATDLVRQCFGCRKRPVLRNCDVCSIGKDLPSSEVLTLVWDQR